MEKRHELESDSESNFVLCADIDAKFPDFLIFKRKEMIKDEDYEPTSIVKIGYGKSCTDDRKVTFTVSFLTNYDFKNISLVNIYLHNHRPSGPAARTRSPPPSVPSGSRLSARSTRRSAAPRAMSALPLAV